MDQALIDSVVRRIVEHVDPSRIYLFGSQATGRAEPDSDIDLLVVADMPGSRRERGREVRKLFADRTFGLDVFVFRPEEFERQKKLLSSISYIAENEGKVLYERA
jgi:predicted nucleotidyltransferase